MEVYPSIGGWTLSDPFPALAANEATRLTFAANCVKLIEDYDFDGIGKFMFDVVAMFGDLKVLRLGIMLRLHLTFILVTLFT